MDSHSIGEMPSHSHNYITAPLLWKEQDTTDNSCIQSHDAGTTNQMTYTTSYTGSSQKHNNLMPYLVTYCWIRKL